MDSQHQTKPAIKVSNDPTFWQRSTDCKPSGQMNKSSVCLAAIGLDSQENLFIFLFASCSSLDEREEKHRY